MPADVMQFEPQVQQAARRFGFSKRADLIQEGFIALLEIQTRLFEVTDCDLNAGQKLAFITAKDAMASYLRRDRGASEVPLTDDAASITPDFSANNEDLRKAMAGLEPSDQYILEEVFFHDKHVKDVALALGRNSAWVTRRKSKAIMALRKIMGL